MIGSYVQYAHLASPPSSARDRWYLALPLAMASGVRARARAPALPAAAMYVGGTVERRDEYATVMTIALMVLFEPGHRWAGRTSYSPRDYAKPTTLLTLPLSGNRFVALIGAMVLLALF